MKCVKNVDTERIERVSDQLARKRVTAGTWKYIPKSQWKASLKPLTPATNE